MNAVMKELAPETARDAVARLFKGPLHAGFALRGLHRYVMPDGSELLRVVRLKHPQWQALSDAQRNQLKERHECDGKGKIIRPIHRASDGSYIAKGPARPATGWPLYVPPYPLVDSGPRAHVEGEACADALAKLGVPACTSIGGAQRANDTDWATAPEQPALVWPDHDEAGRKYAENVTAKLRALGCAVEVVNAGALGVPDKGDAVDWLAMHPNATAADVLALPRLAASFEKQSIEIKDGAMSASAPEPLPAPLPDVPAFDEGMLPASVRAWCVDAADGLQVPLDFTAIPAMVALGGTIGRHVGIAMKQHARWYERPMLWGCVIGRPSSGKSPALSPARRMLERLAGEERAIYDVEAREYEARVMVADAAKANAKKDIQAALKKKDHLGAEAAAEAALFEDHPPSEPRILVNDATVEKLGELLNANPRGLVQYRDELAGWLAGLDRDGRESDRAFWLECWNGTGAFTVDRIGRGTIPIEACAMSILGGMQPGKLAEYVRGAIRGGFSDDGLIQRFQLAVYPDLPTSWTYTDRPIDPKAEASAWATFQNLRALDAGAIGAERHASADVPFLRFDGEAQGLLIDWQTQLMGRLREGNEAAWMESHLAKYPALAGRLALVLHLADGHAGAVTADTLAMALDWCSYLEGHARRIYAPAMDNGLTAAHLILKKRPDLSESFTARDLQRRGWTGLSDRDAIEEGLDLLVECRHLLTQVNEPGPQGGRRTVVFAWRVTP